MSWGRISDNEGIERSRQVGVNSSTCHCCEL
jgi:hypothetical protein